jgi:hypothetical protein
MIANPEDRTKRARKLAKKTKEAMEHFATNHDELTCMSTTHKASEADGKRVASKLGLAEVILAPVSTSPASTQGQGQGRLAEAAGAAGAAVSAPPTRSSEPWVRLRARCRVGGRVFQ